MISDYYSCIAMWFQIMDSQKVVGRTEYETIILLMHNSDKMIFYV